MSYRIGKGIDFHRLEEGLPLVIGGVTIPSSKGALAHSDGDVLLHAICDAILGAMALGDIGQHFPNSDPSLKGINSLILLERTIGLMKQQQFELVNIDTNICLETPKIKPYVPLMQEQISSVTGLSIKDISIKATTTEQLGAIGRTEGLMADAVVLLRKQA
jgi:2-C-methyl-D-erythritol 2,4-cyclodiphosphate synthase